MSESGIDLDRGVVMQRHPQGGYICMYRDEPGAFFREDGEAVSPVQARAAGFDVEKLLIEQEREKRLREAKHKIERDLKHATFKVETELEKSIKVLDRNSRGRPRETQFRKMEFIAGKGWNVIDKRTDQLIDGPVPEEDAEELLMKEA